MLTQYNKYTQDNNTHKTTTTIHTRQLQQYTQENYNTHKTTTTIHTRQLQQYTQENYNNTHKTTTTHTRQLQQYTRPINNNYTQPNLKLATKHTRQIRIQHVQKVKTPK